MLACLLFLSITASGCQLNQVKPTEAKMQNTEKRGKTTKPSEQKSKKPLKSYTSRSKRRNKKVRLSGSLTSEYLYDRLVSPKPASVTHESIGEYLDVRLRKRDVNDFKFVFSGWYVKEFSHRKRERNRISKLYGEMNSPGLHTLVRLGRQPASGNTLFTRFDGLTASYAFDPTFSLNIGGGFPVDTFNNDSIEVDTKRRYYEVFLQSYDFFGGGGKLYYTKELDESFATREAVGLNSYWIKEKLTLSAILDYDLDFSKFNNLLLGGEFSKRNIRYNGFVEFRKNPFLDYRTALFDPGVSGINTSLGSLRETRSRAEIQALAAQNTSDSLDFNLGTVIDFSRIWRGDFRVSHTISEVLIFNNGKETKHSNRFSVLFTERNALSFSEVWTLLLMHQPASDYETNSLTTTLSKFWRNGAGAILRFRWDRSEFSSASSTLTRKVPGFSINYYGAGAFSATLDAEYSIEESSSSPDTLRTIQTRTSITYSF